jgi:predicted enzyme related to lactoylglutathione lyase
MQVKVTSVPVVEQDQALAFYTGVLGFVKKHDIPMGEFRWLTVVSPESPEGVELLLEPMAFPPAKVYQQQLHDAGIPWTAFSVDDIQKEYERLVALGVVFKSKPQKMGPVMLAAFDDSCGNWIQLVQK